MERWPEILSAVEADLHADIIALKRVLNGLPPVPAGEELLDVALGQLFNYPRHAERWIRTRRPTLIDRG